MRVHHCFVILCLVEEMDMERMDYFFLDSLAMVRVGTRCQPCFLLLSLCSFPWSGREFVADQVTISLHAQPPPSSTCCSTRVIPTMPLCLAYPPRPGIAHHSNPFPAPRHGRSYRGLPAHARFCLPLLLDFAQLATAPRCVAGLGTKQEESGGVFFLKRYDL